jgi:hypothetical protein
MLYARELGHVPSDIPLAADRNEVHRGTRLALTKTSDFAVREQAHRTSGTVLEDDTEFPIREGIEIIRGSQFGQSWWF